MVSANIREAVDRHCCSCVHGWGPKGVHEGTIPALDVVDACPLHLCELHEVRPRKAHQ